MNGHISLHLSALPIIVYIDHLPVQMLHDSSFFPSLVEKVIHLPYDLLKSSLLVSKSNDSQHKQNHVDREEIVQQTIVCDVQLFEHFEWVFK